MSLEEMVTNPFIKYYEDNAVEVETEVIYDLITDEDGIFKVGKIISVVHKG